MKQKTAVLILMLVAAIFVIIPLISIIRSAKIKNHGVLVESTVTGVSGKKGLHTVTVTFITTDGNQLTARASKRRYVSTGDKVMIRYDPASPQNIDFGDTTGYNMRGVIAGGLLFIFGLFYFIRYSFRDQATKKLISSGKKIAAGSVTVGRNEKYRMGDQNPWIIKCSWTDCSSDREYHFVSKDYTIDPVPYLSGRNSIDVFIDPLDPGRYHMDTSFMPKGNNTIG
jgi:hypothetical protein